MIELTRLNGTKFILNPFQLEYAEEVGDTVLMLSSGRKMVVKESTAAITDKFTEFLAESIRRGNDPAR
jgi:flagellar protein FlbD